MKVLISGASGLIGGALGKSLLAEGHSVLRLVRHSPAGEGEVEWRPSAATIDRSKLQNEGIDAAVHLAGENIAGRWTVSKKERIHSSRTKGTSLLCESLAELDPPPKVIVSASAIGYYGDRGDDALVESAPPGAGFLPDVCAAWETAAEAARAKGIRVVHPRIGVVLSPAGGALAKMLTPFKLCAGGKIGSGRQWMSWIAIDDMVAVIRHALTNDSVSGPVNTVAPHPATNAEFTRTLGRVLGRPTVFPMPAFAAKLAFGEMAEALLLASAKVVPQKLNETGYTFQFPELEAALRHVLGLE